MTEIDKNYIRRLYNIHERVMDAARDLNAEMRNGELTDTRLNQLANKLEYLTDKMESVFAETLSDTERNKLSIRP